MIWFLVFLEASFGSWASLACKPKADMQQEMCRGHVSGRVSWNKWDWHLLTMFCERWLIHGCVAHIPELTLSWLSGISTQRWCIEQTTCRCHSQYSTYDLRVHHTDAVVFIWNHIRWRAASEVMNGFEDVTLTTVMGGFVLGELKSQQSTRKYTQVSLSGGSPFVNTKILGKLQYLGTRSSLQIVLRLWIKSNTASAMTSGKLECLISSRRSMLTLAGGGLGLGIRRLICAYGFEVAARRICSLQQRGC